MRFVLSIQVFLLLFPFQVPLSGQARESGRVRVEVGDCILEAPRSLEGTLEELAGKAREILPRLERELGIEASAPYRIFLLPSGRERGAELARLDALAPPWAAGFLLASSRVGAIRVDRVGRYPYRDLAGTLAHEATHMLLHDAGGGKLPRWFEEGVATWQGRRWGLRDFLVHSSALLTGELPALEDLDREFSRSSSRARRAYAASFEFVSWSLEEYGEDYLPELLSTVGETGFEEAWRLATGERLRESEESWRRSTVFVYRWVPLLTGSGTLWMVVTALALLAALRRRQRTRELHERWELEERFRAPAEGESSEDEDSQDEMVH